MIKIIKQLLLKVIQDIDAGNSNINEEDAMEMIHTIRRFTDKDERISKYSACQYLGISRATFDNLVRDGKLPKGKHTIGFKELSWTKKELDEYLKSI